MLMPAVLAAGDRRHLMPSFSTELVLGVASYGMELFRAVTDLDAVYVRDRPGLRDLRGDGRPQRAVADDRGDRRGVGRPAGLPAFVRRGEARPTGPAPTIADGMAVRVPDEEALALILSGVNRVVAVSDAELRSAMRVYYTDTHNVAEGAGAAPLAALLQERSRMRGSRVALVLSGGNIDRELFAEVLAGS